MLYLESLLVLMGGLFIFRFHTYDYARHFVSACTRILGLEGTPEGVEDQGKLTRVAAVCVFRKISPSLFESPYFFICLSAYNV